MNKPFLRNHLIRDAIGQAIYEEMAKGPAIHLFGEGAQVKTHYDAPQIERDFADRVHTLPISEDGNINFCVGASLLGIKPVYDVIAADFLYRAMDSICNTAAKLNFTRPNEEPRTIVIRAEFLTGGPTTGQRPEVLFCHIPGLNVVAPSTPHDAYGLMRRALNIPGVTLFFEDREIPDDSFNEEDKTYGEPIPLGEGFSRRGYTRVPKLTIVTYGMTRYLVDKVLEDNRGNRLWSRVELLDLRTLYPLDWYLLGSSLDMTDNLLIVEPDVTYGGIGAEIAATVAENRPDVRIKRLGGPRATISASSDRDPTMPTEAEILNAIRNW